jgi:AcrR family transcriptional regulator
MSADAAEATTSPVITPPRQSRSKEAWQRILDAGVDVLCEVGASRFTVSAVCEKAGVAPTAIYARARSRDDLLFAAYDHGTARVEETERLLVSTAVDGPDPRAAVEGLGRVFERHSAFLRSTVLSSAEYDYVAQRGAQNVARARARFVEAAVGADASHERRSLALTVFSSVFSVLCMSVAYGPRFAGEETTTETVEQLADLAERVLGSSA